MFSKSCEYALRAVIYTAHQSALGYKSGAKEIAEAIDSPEAFTGKILQKLAKANILTSTKGPYGGFSLHEAEARQIQLIEVVRAIDGDNLFTRCGLGLKHCSAKNPCPMHDDFLKVRNELLKMLKTNTVFDVIHESTEFPESILLKR